MARAQIDQNNRIVTWIRNEDLSLEDADDILALFPVEFSNQELIDNTVSYSTSDFVIRDGLAYYEPLKESVEAMAHSMAIEYAPEHLSDTDDAICHLYEETLAQQEIMDEQDAAICALYEMIGA